MSDYYEPGPHPSLDRDRPARQSLEREREPHALTLKVLRASRPSLTQSQDIARDPTTLGEASTSGFRLTPLLALPAAFGNINLGETFLGVVVAANESNREVFDPALKIEIQTANARTTLWESPAPNAQKPRTLKPGDSLEAPLLDYEIKEPGLHALTCSISYWLPAPSSYNDSDGPSERVGRSFRKLYKFQATNPLSVKTKVHSSKNVAASMDEAIEHTVFLEVQIQNVSLEPLFFEHLLFAACEGLQVQDHNAKVSVPLQPLDILQCLYIISPEAAHKQAVLERARLAAGAMALGKLDIRWRGRMGDSGHLTTSQLHRKLPMPPLPPLISPRPSFQNLRTGLSALSPNQTPERPGNLGGIRTPSPNNSPRLETGTFSPSPRPSFQFDETLHSSYAADLQARLYTLPLSETSFEIQKAFQVEFDLKLVSTCRTPTSTKKRRLRLAVQHVDHSHVPVDIAPPNAADSTSTVSARQSLETSRPLPPTPRRSIEMAADIALPPPYPLPANHPFNYRHSAPGVTRPSNEACYVGSSLVVLDDVTLDHSAPIRDREEARHGDSERAVDNPDIRISIDSTATDDLSLSEVIKKGSAARQQTTRVRFSLKYIAFTTGIHKLGGVRILLLEDGWVEQDEDGIQHVHGGLKRCALVEHDVVTEVLLAGIGGK